MTRRICTGMMGLVLAACSTDAPAGGGPQTASGITGVPAAGDGSTSAEDDDPAETGIDATTGANCEDDSECPPGFRCGAGSSICLAPAECLTQDDCDDGLACEDGMCGIGGDCGGFEFSIEAVPPNVMVLLDRSGSMASAVEGTGASRWDVAAAAVEQVTAATDTSIRWGLATYSSCLGGGCSAGSIVVPIADGNAAAIAGFLATTTGEGSSNGMAVNGAGLTQYLCNSGAPETSTGRSLFAMVGEPSLLDPERDNAVLLITDGSESGDCTGGGMNGPSGAAALLAQAPGVKTYAVGFVGANEGELQSIATAGGTETSFFADQPMELQAALDTITQAVASCTFTLDQVPPDPNQIYVFFNKQTPGVPMDAANGWSYDPATNTLTINGSSCEQVKGGSVEEIDIVYGCNQVPVG